MKIPARRYTVKSGKDRRGAFRRRIVALSAIFAAFLLNPAAVPADENTKIVEVLDGDTVRVREGGEDRTVRLIGIDAPERSHPSRSKEFLADESADFLASLCGGKNVRMESDGEDLDRHGRLLRYLFLPLPDGRLINKEMVRQGYARTYRRFPFSRENEFLEAEAEARKNDKGIWREGGFAEARWMREHRAPGVEILPSGGGNFSVACDGMVKSGVGRDDLGKTVQEILRLRTENSDKDFRDAARKAGFAPLEPRDPRTSGVPGGAEKHSPTDGASGSSSSAPLPRPSVALRPGVIQWDEAHLHIGKEVVVEGTLTRVHRAKKVLYLNFHPNWKKYLTVVVLGKDLYRFPKDAKKIYEGKTVRVKGKVKTYKDRPEIVIHSPKSITIIR